jgi:hypothetical protein
LLVCVQVSYIEVWRKELSDALPGIAKQAKYLAEQAAYEIDVDELLFLGKAREALGTLVKNLSAHKETVKEFFSANDVFSSLALIIQKETRIAAITQCTYGLANCIIVQATNPSLYATIKEASLKCMQTLISMIKSGKNLHAALYALGSMAIKFDNSFRNKIFATKILSKVHLYVKQNDDEILRARSLMILRNLALSEKLSKDLHNYSICYTLIIDPKLDAESLHQLLALMANLSIDDTISQSLSTNAMIQALYNKLVNTKDDKITSLVLLLVGNLAIDLTSLQMISTLFKPILEETLYAPPQEYLADAVVVIHNLIVLDTESSTSFVKKVGFFDAIVKLLSSENRLLQSCALRIITHYLKTGKASYKKLISNTTCLALLLMIMSEGKTDTAFTAQHCFTTIVGSGEEGGEKFKDDPFTHIGKKWALGDKNEKVEAVARKKMNLSRSNLLGSRNTLGSSNALGTRRGSFDMLGSRNALGDRTTSTNMIGSRNALVSRAASSRSTSTNLLGSRTVSGAGSGISSRASSANLLASKSRASSTNILAASRFTRLKD